MSPCALVPTTFVLRLTLWAPPAPSQMRELRGWSNSDLANALERIGKGGLARNLVAVELDGNELSEYMRSKRRGDAFEELEFSKLDSIRLVANLRVRRETIRTLLLAHLPCPIQLLVTLLLCPQS